MSVRIEHCWGYHLRYSGGDCGLPDCESPVELPERKSAKLTESDVEEIKTYVRACDEEERILSPFTSVRRVEGVFAKFDFGGYWSLWVFGDTKEDVMEQLDDLYGVYEDYL